MPRLTQEQIDDIKARFRMHPAEYEERISTLDKPLIIESACPGWQPKYWGPREIYPTEPPGYQEGGVRFPAVPVSIDEQVKENVAAAKCGAAAIHFHPRDPKTGIAIGSTTNAELHAQLMTTILDRTFQEVDVVTLQHTWKIVKPELSKIGAGIDYVSDMEELVTLGGGNKYCQGSLVLFPPQNSYPVSHDQAAQDGVKYMQEHGVKPIIKVRSTYHVREMKRTLLDTGILTTEPMVIIHDMGHPYGWPLDIDPWMPIELISSIEQTKQRIPDSVIGVYSGGRNWFPITITAILSGVDIVRVGIEDCYWMYPHKDEIISSNAEVVKLTADLARMVGREVATAKQAREIMGIKLISRMPNARA